MSPHPTNQLVVCWTRVHIPVVVDVVVQVVQHGRVSSIFSFSPPLLFFVWSLFIAFAFLCWCYKVGPFRHYFLVVLGWGLLLSAFNWATISSFSFGPSNPRAPSYDAANRKVPLLFLRYQPEVFFLVRSVLVARKESLTIAVIDHKRGGGWLLWWGGGRGGGKAKLGPAGVENKRIKGKEEEEKMRKKRKWLLTLRCFLE